MIKQIILWLCVGGGLISCTQDIAPITNNPIVVPKTLDSIGTKSYTSDKKLIAMGSFQNAVHQTTGIAKIYADSAQKSYALVLENFRTDAGPDLRIYLAEDRAVTNFIQISDKVQHGNVVYDIPNDTDFRKRNHVLIWCKSFSVLFGVAELK
ncbi:DM13 domain-containing protein [Flectobacillus longus]|uniref:DM13 domain-containing protein n=1 Tax=Flectobacillus longus TaxID=2984207 RepID=UPI0024B81B7D|nr:DM13 domain-containing protein [Flectobacillus longus]MDI9879372.1 DM13 domain-containing protein [Flectobacillus longus]